MNPPMPTRFIHSRSIVMPSLVTLLIVQCHHVRGLAESGGVLNPAASGSPPGCANEETGVQAALMSDSTIARVSRATMRVLSIVLGFPRPGEAGMGNRR
jgi:hypothetical protein